MSDRAVDLEPTIDARPVVTDLSEAERNPAINPVPEETENFMRNSLKKERLVS